MAAADVVRGVDNRDSGAVAATGIFVTLTAPGGIQTGDPMLASINLREAPSTLAGWRAPAGWTLIASPALSAGSCYVYRATYGVDVTGTSWTWDNGAGNTTSTMWAASLVALAGTQVGAYLDSAAQATASTATLTTPTLTTAGSSYLVAMAGTRSSGTRTFSWPSGWVEEGDDHTATSSTSVANSTAVYDTTPAPAGSYSVTATASSSAASGYAAIVAFGPATAPGLNLSGTGTLALTGSPALAGTLARTSTGALTTGTPPAAWSGSLARTSTGALSLAGVGSWPHLSVTATPDPTFTPPRIRIDIADTRSSPATSITITRTNPDGHSYPVRTADGGPLTVSAGSATIFDYEAPYDSPITYTTDVSGGPTVATELDGVDDVWLVHTGVPSRSCPVKVTSLPPGTRATSSTPHKVLGSSLPVPISSGARQARASVLGLRTFTDEQSQALDQLCDDDSVLLLNIPATKSWGWSACYVSVGDLAPARTVAYGRDAKREWQLPIQVVGRPGGGTQAAITWNVESTQYTSWNAIKAAGVPSWAQLASPTT